MIVIHHIPTPVMDGPEMAQMQTAVCGMRLPRHRYHMPKNPDRSGHYWHTRPWEHLNRPDLDAQNLSTRMCEGCAVTSNTENVFGEPLENMRNMMDGA